MMLWHILCSLAETDGIISTLVIGQATNELGHSLQIWQSHIAGNHDDCHDRIQSCKSTRQAENEER